MKVQQIMAKNPVVIAIDAETLEAYQVMKRHQIHHLLVQEDGRVVGVVSKWDFRPLINFLDEAGALKTPPPDELRLFNLGRVADIMTPNPITIAPESTVQQAAGLMLQHEVHCLPVMEQDQVIGVLTTHDLIQQVSLGTLSAEF